VPDQVVYFNHENVDEVVFEGFKDTEEDRFQTLYEKWQEENGQSIKRGKVTEALK